MSTCVTRKQNGCLFIEPHFHWISGKISLATELSIKSVTGCHGKVHCMFVLCDIMTYSQCCTVLQLGMGRLAWCLVIESILLKYYDEILKLPLRLPAHIMEGRVKILETYPKSEEMISFCTIFLCFCKLL